MRFSWGMKKGMEMGLVVKFDILPHDKRMKMSYTQES